MQHGSDAFVAQWKSDVIAEGLAARGLKTEIRPMTTSPPSTRRRAVFHARRTKTGAMIGFKMRGTDTLVEVPDCQVLDPGILAVMPFLKNLTRRYASRKGEIDWAVTLSHAGLDIDIRGARILTPEEISELANQSGSAGIARLTWDGEDVAVHAHPTQIFGGTPVVPPPASFLQATQHGEEALWTSVSEALKGAKSVVDLFAGCGTFALRSAAHSEVSAYENAPEMIAALSHAWRQKQGLKGVNALSRDLFRRPLLPMELDKFDAIIIDPPRAGAEAQTREIAKSSVPRICAVSCNPITFARDAQILSDGGYTLDWLQPVDQFRWSAHVELAAQFTK